MFFAVKLKWVVVSFALIVIGLAIVSVNIGNDAVDAALDLGPKTILVDAGHGLPDGGTTNNGVTEESLNLQVAFKLKSQLEQNGFKVIMTREDANGLHDDNVSNKKRSDLNKRVRMMDEYSADLFVSIHMNQFPESKYKGAQVFYSKNNKESAVLGKIIQKDLVEIVDKTNKREAKEGYDSIFVLKRAKIPAVLVECGFLSNPEERALLQQDDYQNTLAYAISSGIIKYYENLSKAENAEAVPSAVPN